jgi:ABC-type transporter Mla MlaB component
MEHPLHQGKFDLWRESMLRITVNDQVETLTFQLEGRLVGPWVGELEKAWREILAARARRRVQIDLTGVIFIDSAGKEFLAVAHRAGAEFITADCLMNAIVSEVSRSRLVRR